MRGPFRVELFRPHHSRPAEHRCQRCAQLVRHHRDEIVLRSIGGLRLRPCRLFGSQELVTALRGLRVLDEIRRLPSKEVDEAEITSRWLARCVEVGRDDAHDVARARQQRRRLDRPHARTLHDAPKGRFCEGRITVDVTDDDPLPDLQCPTARRRGLTHLREELEEFRGKALLSNDSECSLLGIAELDRAAVCPDDLDDGRQDVAEKSTDVAAFEEPLADAVQAHDGVEIRRQMILQRRGFLLSCDALEPEGDVMGNGLGDLELISRNVVRLVVVEHELAEQFAFGDERNEGERAETFRPEQRVERRERVVGERIGNHDALGIRSVARPRRMAFDRRAVLLRQVPPRAEAHHSRVVERQHAGAVRHHARHERREGLVINGFGRRRTTDTVNQVVEDSNHVARLVSRGMSCAVGGHGHKTLLRGAAPFYSFSGAQDPPLSSFYKRAATPPAADRGPRDPSGPDRPPRRTRSGRSRAPRHPVTPATEPIHTAG